MKVRAKTMAFDGMRRVRPGQTCEIADNLVKRDKEGKIIRPKWAQDVDAPIAEPAISPYKRNVPENSPAAFEPPVVESKPAKGKGSRSVI